MRFNPQSNSDHGKIACRICRVKKPKEEFPSNGLRIATVCTKCKEFLEKDK